jgi:putative salt-induced outer membrane protein YdiY
MLHRIALAALLCFVASASRAESVVLANGDRLNVEVVERGADHIVIEHPQLGQVRLSLDQLDVEAGDLPNPGIFGTNILRGWSRTLDIGVNGRQGNSETTSITVGLELSLEDQFKRWEIQGRSFFARDEDGTSDNNARFTLRRDHFFFESPWFAFGSVSYGYDQFESWKHRIVASSGPGYRLVQREAQELDLRLGATYTREFGERGRNEANFLFGVDYSWKPGERHTFTLENQLFTEVQPSPGELRNLTIAGWKVKILEEPALSLKAAVENEYETEVEDDDKKNDLKYYVGVGIDF